MANTIAKRGLVNPRLVTGGTPHTETRKVSSGVATTFFPGQLIGTDANGWAVRKTADANATFIGVCMSYLPPPSTAAASQVNEIQVVTDMINTVWELQLSTASTGQTLIGNNVSLTDVVVFNGTAKQSRMYGGTPVTTAQPWKIVGFANDPKNESTNGTMRVIVRLNEATSTATLFHHFFNPAGT